MYRTLFLCCLGVFVSLAGARPVAAQGKVSKTQSASRPFGLEIADSVRRVNSDSRASAFNKDYLKKLGNLDSAALSKSLRYGNSSSVMVDPSKLQLSSAYDTRVYFISEGAGYHNTLGFNTSGGGVASGDPQLIFPDASSGNGRSTSEPLRSGDFVNLGTMKSGTKLDFFLVANGANGGTNVYSTEDSVNPDGIRHVMSHAQIFPGSPYLMLAFEDLYGGGDQDYNDLIVAIDIGAENIEKIVKTIGAPEPGACVSLLTFLVVAAEYRRRRKDDDG
jgi:hypothetical protein